MLLNYSTYMSDNIRKINWNKSIHYYKILIHFKNVIK